MKHLGKGRYRYRPEQSLAVPTDTQVRANPSDPAFDSPTDYETVWNKDYRGWDDTTSNTNYEDFRGGVIYTIFVRTSQTLSFPLQIKLTEIGRTKWEVLLWIAKNLLKPRFLGDFQLLIRGGTRSQKTLFMLLLS